MALLVVAQPAAEQVGQEPLEVQPAEVRLEQVRLEQVRLEQVRLEQELPEHPAGQSFPARIAVAAVAEHFAASSCS